jgi:hypothetical protein
VTRLRQRMLDELQRCNYAATTTEYYLRTLERFARYFRRPPDQLTPHHIRTYQTYLLRERKLHPHGESCDRAFHCGRRRPRWVADRSGRARRVRYDTGSVADRVSLLWRSRGRDLFFQGTIRIGHVPK